MVNARVDLPTAQRAVEAAGYTVQSIEPAKGDWPHDKYRVTVIGQGITDPTAFNASFHADFGQVWAGRRIEPIFNGEISLEREAGIYKLVRDAGLPAPRVTVEKPKGHQAFLLEEILGGKPIKEHILALPAERRKSAYLDAAHKVGELLARVHEDPDLRFKAYGDVWGKDDVRGGTTSYVDRLRKITTDNFAFNPHDDPRAFSPAELQRVREHMQKKLLELESVKSGEIDVPTLILANLHRGNVHLDEQGKIVGIGQFHFAQAGVPAAEFYNAFFQFADAEVAPTQKVHQALLNGYWSEGADFHPNNPTNQTIMSLLTANHFLYATTVYSTRQNDPMRNRWGKRFKEDILFPLIDEGKVNHDTFAAIINEKWK